MELKDLLLEIYDYSIIGYFCTVFVLLKLPGYTNTEGIPSYSPSTHIFAALLPVVNTILSILATIQILCFVIILVGEYYLHITDKNNENQKTN